uniref:Methyltransferase domain-containing protein n=1 Tax=Lotharella oceanica TaxID=641309 RepID=A0A7S2X8J1_9EUKA|mmetsp:Transcript_17882/g.33884  ORF Transcript_17882/g.33884 Transcript_17882/m.33884 type:complete len:298 (+) Transcript_17882:61-954(+)
MRPTASLRGKCPRLPLSRLTRRATRARCLASSSHAATEYDRADVASSFAAMIKGLDEGKSGGLFEDFECNSFDEGLRRLGLSSLEGLRVLDAGCGEGRFARRFCAAGARVIGCDSSPAMVKAARETQQHDGHDAEYVLMDVSSAKAALGHSVDLCVSIYVMQMAKRLEQLQDMCAFLRRHSDRSLIFTVNGEYAPRPRQSELMLRHLGFQSLRAPGTTDRIHFVMRGSSTPVTNYQYSEDTYLQCLEKAGYGEVGAFDFRGTEAHRARVLESGEEEEKELIELVSANPHIKCFWGKA